MVDHTKFNKKYMSKIANIDDFDIIITDSKLDNDTSDGKNTQNYYSSER